jgi:hypothetical protein
MAYMMVDGDCAQGEVCPTAPHPTPFWSLVVASFLTLFEKRRFVRLCGLVARVPGYRSRGLGSIPGATKFSEK